MPARSADRRSTDNAAIAWVSGPHLCELGAYLVERRIAVMVSGSHLGKLGEQALHLSRKEAKVDVLGNLFVGHSLIILP
jgi:hypothetical protein